MQNDKNSVNLTNADLLGLFSSQHTMRLDELEKLNGHNLSIGAKLAIRYISVYDPVYDVRKKAMEVLGLNL